MKKEIRKIYEPFALGIYKFDKKIDNVKILIYICNSMINNLKYRGKYLLMKGFKCDISEITRDINDVFLLNYIL